MSYEGKTFQTAFCAICVSDDGPFEWRPLGVDDAMVIVCKRCDDEHPRDGGYSFSDGAASSLRNGADGNRHTQPRKG